MRVHRGATSAAVVAVSCTQLAEATSVADLAKWTWQSLAGEFKSQDDGFDDAERNQGPNDLDDEPEVDLSDDFFEAAHGAKKGGAAEERNIDWREFERFLSQNNGTGFGDFSTNNSDSFSTNNSDAFSGGGGQNGLPASCKYGEWSAWSAWGECKVHAGQGAGTKQKKTRSRTEEGFSSGCPAGSNAEEKFKDCVVDPCTNAYGAYGAYGTCQEYTGTEHPWQFFHERTRTTTDSTNCVKTTEKASCTPPAAPAQCEWNAWGAWGSFGTCTVHPQSAARKQTRSRSRARKDASACNGGYPTGDRQEFEDQTCQTACAAGDTSCIVSDVKCAAQGTNKGQCNRLWLGTASNRGNCFWDDNTAAFAKKCRHASLTAQDMCAALSTQAACEVGLSRDLFFDSAKKALQRSTGVLCHWDNIEDKCVDKKDQASAPVCVGTVSIGGVNKNLDVDAMACQNGAGAGREFEVLGQSGAAGKRSCRALGIEIGAGDVLKADKCVPVSAAKKLLPTAAVKTVKSTSEQKTALGGKVSQLMAPTDTPAGGITYDAAKADPTSNSASFDMIFAKTMSDARKTPLDADLGIARTPKKFSRAWTTGRRRGRALSTDSLEFGVETEVAIKIVNTATDGSVKMSKKDTLLLGVATGTVSPAAFIAVQEEEKAKVAAMTGETSTAATLSMTKDAAPTTVFGNKEVALVSLGGFADAVALMPAAAKTAAVASLNTALTSAGKPTVAESLVADTTTELAAVKVLAKQLTGETSCDATCKAALAAEVDSKLNAVPGIDLTKIAAVPAASVSVAGLGTTITVAVPTAAVVQDVSNVATLAAPAAIKDSVQESASDDVFAAAEAVPASQVAPQDEVCGYDTSNPEAVTGFANTPCADNLKTRMKEKCIQTTAPNANGNPVCAGCAGGKQKGAYKTDPVSTGTGLTCDLSINSQSSGGGGAASGAVSSGGSDSSSSSSDSGSGSSVAAASSSSDTGTKAPATSGAASKAGLLAAAGVAAVLCL